MSNKKWAVLYVLSLAAWAAAVLYSLSRPTKAAEPPMVERVVCQTALGKSASAVAKVWNMDHGSYYHDKVVFVPPEGSECGVLSVPEPKL